MVEEQRGHTMLLQSCLVLVLGNLDRHCVIAVEIERFGSGFGVGVGVGVGVEDQRVDVCRPEDRAGWIHEVPQVGHLVHIKEEDR